VAEGVPERLQPHKESSGNRIPLPLLIPALNVFSCGQLLSMYEHRVVVQGFMWGGQLLRPVGRGAGQCTGQQGAHVPRPLRR
jgi:hypothetical protein